MSTLSINKPAPISLHPIWALRRMWWRLVVVFGSLSAVAVFGPRESLMPALTLLVPLGLLVIIRGPLLPLCRLTSAVARFRALRSARVVLYYASAVEAPWNFETLLRTIEDELDQQSQLFSITLRRPVAVFLFKSWQDIARLYGPHYGAAALTPANALLISSDCNMREVIAHELAHLFSNRWNQHAPPLMSEGLSTWVQGTENGIPVDDLGKLYAWSDRPRLRDMVKHAYFFAEPQRRSCYIVAGGFVGYLIRMYGWSQLRAVFRLCDGTHFEKKFQRCYGMTLDEAQAKWRSHYLAQDLLKSRFDRDLTA